MKLERIPAPAAGMNSDAAPDAVAANQAPLLVNMLPGRAGKAVMRGAFTAYYSNVANLPSHDDFSALIGPFVWAFDDTLLVQTAGMPTNKIIVWKPPGLTSTVLTGVMLAGSRHARLQDCVYGPVVPASGTGGPNIGRWGPTLTSALTRYTNAPTAFIDVKAHLRRLIVLGGTPAGGGTLEQRALYWSDPIGTGTPLPDTLAAWQDDVSGLANKLVFADSDTPVGLAKVGRWLAILMKRSIYLLTGDSPSNWSIRRLTAEFGCLDALSVVEVDDGFYFLSDRGYAFCDGADVRVVSEPINTSILGGPDLGDTPGLASTAAMLPGGFIALTLGTATAVPLPCLLYHVDTGAWAAVDTALFKLPAKTNLRVYRTPSTVLLFDGNYFIDASFMTNPESQAAGDIAFKPGQDGDGASPGTRYTIVPKWYSRLARLGGPGQMAHTKRILFDFVLKAQNTSRTGLRVEAHDGYGNLLGSAMTTANARTDGYRQRFQAELYAETDTIQLQVSRDQETATGDPGPPGIVALEFLDAAVEFDDGRSRPSR